MIQSIMVTQEFSTSDRDQSEAKSENYVNM